jgi:hypothetical protein
MTEPGLGSTGSGQGQVADSIKGEEMPDRLRDYQLLKEECAQLSRAGAHCSTVSLCARSSTWQGRPTVR